MYQTLYRKYRPTSFNEVFGQQHITDILSTEVATGKVSHAYLFCGSRGTGKTTCAKILAKAVNCEHPIDGNPCNECDSCKMISEGKTLDVVEMDAASNNGVANIRDLIDEIVFLPSALKKKVYIIDEVHMLSGGAFNALLKTLEEPPEHVLFILATTELHKIPATIVSRCQRFDFRRIKAPVIKERLVEVAEREGLSLEENAANMLAHLADGALRDALSLLESCAGKGISITPEVVTMSLGLSRKDELIEIVNSISLSNAAKAIKLFSEIYESVGDVQNFFSDLLAIYRDLLFIKTISSSSSLNLLPEEKQKLEVISENFTTEKILYDISVIENLQNNLIDLSTNKRSISEITLIKLCHSSTGNSFEALSSRISELELMLKNGTFTSNVSNSRPKEKEPAVEESKDDLPWGDEKTPAVSEPSFETSAESKKEKTEPTTAAPPVDSGKKEGYEYFSKGRDLFELVGKKDGIAKSMLGRAKLYTRGETLVIECSDSFSKQILTKPNTKTLIIESLKLISPNLTDVICEETNKKNDGIFDISSLEN